MAQRSRFNNPQNPQPIRLGQVTVGKNTDNRVEERVGVEDGEENIIQMVELIFQDTGPVRRSPTYNYFWRGTYDGLIKLSNLLNAIIDAKEGVQDAEPLPIEMSRYDDRYKRGKRNDE